MSLESNTTAVRAAGVDPITAVDGRLEREYQALKSGAGLRQLDDRLIVRVSGDDRISFLHGMCTADVKGLTPGAVAAALFVTERAHVIADFFIYALADAFLIEIGRDAWPRVLSHLEQFLVADDVEFDELASLSVVDFEGPGAAAVLAESGGGSTPESWHFDPASTLARIPRFGVAAFTMLVETDEVATTLARVDPENKVVRLGAEALEVIRVENGLARVGIDTGEKTLALEARLDRAISLDKGCYIGQETLERATARGAIKRRLCGLRIEGSRLPDAGSVILAGEKPVGVLTSIVRSPTLGLIGLSVLHHSVWPEGTRVVIRDGHGALEAQTADLPFRNP
ncbi:MAG TPA: glycine cleavage T C-terminal barrel domain-containing protein [Candidatus Binataceae bacterium]|nr:glycine cleavage T C-terminal barrel domain-containing protein [Candidatus Binataceae bacterium]